MEKRRNNYTNYKKNGKEVAEKFGTLFNMGIKEVFEKLPLSKSHIKQLREIIINSLYKGVFTESFTGVIIAGFGEKEIFPSLIGYEFHELLDKKLKYIEKINDGIDYNKNAWIVPFAQREMVNLFMTGVDPNYLKTEQDFLSGIFNEYTEIVVKEMKKYSDKEKKKFKHWLGLINEQILEDHNSQLNAYRQSTYVDPIIKVVSSLPKEDLAIMAETLVNLTSFKRKVTLELETVAGPIDVAVISKTDGFIWIKRKHYFQKELNPQFFAKYNLVT